MAFKNAILLLSAALLVLSLANAQDIETEIDSGDLREGRQFGPGRFIPRPGAFGGGVFRPPGGFVRPLGAFGGRPGFGGFPGGPGRFPVAGGIRPVGGLHGPF